MKVIDLMQMYVNKEVLPKKIIIHDHQVFDEDTIWEHKNKVVEGFTEKYNVDKLVYYEYTTNVLSAISRVLRQIIIIIIIPS